MADMLKAMYICAVKATMKAQHPQTLTSATWATMAAGARFPVVDTGFYYDKPEDDLSSMLYPNTAASKFATGVYYYIGMNPYFEDAEEFEFLSDRGSISPANEDSIYDEVDTVYTGIMRNLKQFYYMVIDKETGEVLWDKTINGTIQKNADTSGNGYINPTGVTGTKIKAWTGEGTNEGQTVLIRTGGKAYYDKWDDSRAPMAYWEFPVTLDNTAPRVVDSWANGSKITVKITDNHYAAYAGIFALDNTEEPIQTYCIAENERGAVTTIEFDMGDRDSVFLVLGDYAGNEVQYQVFDSGAVHEPLPSPPDTDETYYAPVYNVEYGETFIITTNGEFVGQPDTVYALTGIAAQPYGIRLQGVTVEVTDS